MKMMYRLTLIHLKQNKKRTLVTMLGIIISVAMITAVGAGYTSSKHYIEEYTIEYTGRWHVAYTGKVSEEPKYKGNANLRMFSKNIGYADFSKSINEDKPYLYLYAYEKNTFEQMPFELKEGRYAKNDSELVLSQHMLDNGGAEYKIGDKITLEMGQRFVKGETVGEKQFLEQNNPYQNGKDGEEKEEFQLTGKSKTYTVVGIIERPELEEFSAPGYSVFTFLDRATLTSDDTITDYVYFKPVSQKDIKPFQGKEAYVMNRALLRNCGLFGNEAAMAVFAFLGILLMVIIMIGTISLIYNAFAISASDRGKEFGMLASVGATRKQKRNAVLMEAVVMSAFCLPVGILSGLAGIGITFQALGKYFRWAFDVNTQMVLTMTWRMILVIILVSLFTIFISAWIPAKRASRMSAIDAVMMRKDYSYSAKTVKTPKIVRKIFGFEGELALKNLKRNKRQYRAMTFSLMITFVLFTTLTTYMNLVTDSYNTVVNAYDYDIEIITWNPVDENIGLMEELNKVEGVKKSNLVYKIWMHTAMPKKEVLQVGSKEMLSWLNNEEVADIYGIDIHDKNFTLGTSLYGLEEEDMATYAEQIGMSKEQIQNMDPTEIILVNQKQTRNNGYYSTYEMFDVKDGSNLNLTISNKAWTAKVAKVTDVYPMGTKDMDNFNVTIIMSRKGIEQLVKEYGKDSKEINSFTDIANASYYFTVGGKNPLEIQENMDDTLINNKMEAGTYSLYNTKEQNARAQAINSIIRVLADGFIVLISLICIANLCNTIATSFELRRREFAMLKSVGMEKKKFNRMIRYESMFYGMKALLFGIPISLLIIAIMYRGMSAMFYRTFQLPLLVYFVAILGIIVIISIGMFYASGKIAKENIMDGLRMQ